MEKGISAIFRQIEPNSAVSLNLIQRIKFLNRALKYVEEI